MRIDADKNSEKDLYSFLTKWIIPCLPVVNLAAAGPTFHFVFHLSAANCIIRDRLPITTHSIGRIRAPEIRPFHALIEDAVAHRAGLDRGGISFLQAI